YLNLGNEAQSAYYYERLVDTDSTLTGEDKLQIAEAFASDRRNGFRFVYPPALADFREELAKSGAALRAGDPEGAIGLLSEIPKGCGEYSAAQELLAVAMLLKGDAEGAEETCLALLKENANDVQALATLSALYSEEDRKSESREIADRLCSLQGTTAEEKYKIATVACENGMHDKALELFSQLEKEFPYDGNLLYFKAAAAGESGNYALAEAALGKLTDLYPEAEVAKYYLGALRLHKIYPGEYECPPFTYFYRVPESEKTARTAELKTF
ncbi:MAG: tetratricopeptide repeat protein, partial [Lachnospiraceae bacterium]